MNKYFLYLILLLAFNTSFADEVNHQLVGVNLSGAEYGGELKAKAKQGYNYIWHTEKDIQRFINAGFTIIRLPFIWERLQPDSKTMINNAEAINIDKILMYAENENLQIILDPHNFGYYGGKLIGTDAKSLLEFKNLWSQLANRYKRFPNVIFGLMNEPHEHTTTEWAKVAQAGIDGIREVGAKQLILVPGTHWSGAHSWTWGKGKDDPSNAEALTNIKDPINNFAYEMHFYLDKDSSGTHKECVSEEIGVERLKASTEWLKTNGKKAFLGEFGVADNPICLKALDKTLTFLKVNADVWLGWTYWSASKWGEKYMFDIYSLDSTKQKQFSIIQKYLKY
jgi:endoglucanase